MPVSDSLRSTFMQDLPVYLAIAGFLAMGIDALLKPRLVTAQFDIPETNTARRNEVCAVYGGFGVSFAVVLGCPGTCTAATGGTPAA